MQYWLKILGFFFGHLIVTICTYKNYISLQVGHSSAIGSGVTFNGASFNGEQTNGSSPRTVFGQFGCGILKMVGPKMQDLCPRINVLKGIFLKTIL